MPIPQVYRWACNRGHEFEEPSLSTPEACPKCEELGFLNGIVREIYK